MPLDMRAIEELAPDQSSLKAAAGLTRPAKWSGISISADATLMWGLCAGSGANPYKVAVDLRDHGSKCTCPSRKFPCKHGIALMWMKAESMVAFTTQDVPEWVGDWLKKRRGPPVNHGTAGKSADDAEGQPATTEDPKVAARREAAALKRLAENDVAISGAFDALEQWISDQLRTGLSAFVDDAVNRCRRIAARVVDGKATTLAGRIDQFPSRLLAVPVGDRVRVVVDELSKLLLLSRAYRRDPRNQDVRRSITSAETRETLLSDPGSHRVVSTWEVVAERLVTRQDGLISQTTWLLNLGEGPRFAMLLDFHPASAGRRGSVFAPGEQFEGEIVFFASANPLRALLVAKGDTVEDVPWPRPDGGSIIDGIAARLASEPWCPEIPVLLPPGRIVLDGRSTPWWRSDCGNMAHPIVGASPTIARGASLEGAVAVWSANRLEPLSGRTMWGRIGFDV